VHFLRLLRAVLWSFFGALRSLPAPPRAEESRRRADPRILTRGAVAANAIKAVLNGGFPPSTAGNPRPFGMPPYAGRLSEADIAAVLTYARASWGNDAAPVSTLDIERYR